MNIYVNAAGLILLLAILFGMVTLVLLLTAKSNRISNRYLALLTLIFMGSLLHNLLIETRFYEQRPGYYFLPVIARLGIGPLLWMYVRSMTSGRNRSRTDILHLLPVLAELGVYSWAFFLETPEKNKFWTTVFEPYLRPAETWGGNISLVIYAGYAFLLLNRWRQHIAHQFSNTGPISLRWLNRLLAGYAALALLAVAWQFAGSLFPSEPFLLPTDILKSCLIFAIGIYAWKQVNLLHRQSQNIAPAAGQEAVEVAVDIPATAVSFDQQLLEQIIKRIEDDRLYLDPDLTVFKLAGVLNMSSRIVSATINKGTGQTFAALINSCRVKEVQKRLAAGDQQKLTLLAIAFECGFNSKSSFNRVFREVTGKNPSEYIGTAKS